MASEYDALLDPAPTAAASPYDALLDKAPAQSSPYDALLKPAPSEYDALLTNPNPTATAANTADGPDKTGWSPSADDVNLVNQAAREGKPVIFVDGKPTLGEKPKDEPLSVGDRLVQGAESALGTTALRIGAGLSRIGSTATTDTEGNTDTSLADSLSKDATQWQQQRPTDIASKVGAGIGGAASLIASGGLPGAIANIGLQSQAEKLSFTSALKAAPEMAAYWLLGMGASKMVGPLVKQSSPFVKTLVSSIAATAANVTSSAAIRAANGQPITPDAESLAQDALFGFGAHGIEAGREAVADKAQVSAMLERAPDDALQMAASDPDFRKSAPYDPKLIDAELQRRAKAEPAPETAAAVATPKPADSVTANAATAELKSVAEGAATPNEAAPTTAAVVEKIATEAKASEVEPPVKSEEPQPAAESPKDWTDATADEPAAPQQMKRATAESGSVSIPKFADRTMSELDEATTERSARLQKSFYEATEAQKEINDVAPATRTQNAISVWMEANGDDAILKNWEATAKEKEFKDAAHDAQSLSPDQIGLAKKAKTAFDVLAKRGEKYGVLGSFRENYVPHVWEVEKQGKGGFGSGRLQENFKFSKARTFENFAQGDAAGFKPKTLAIGNLLPAYLHEMNKVIADRQFVQDLSARSAADSRPLVVPRGRVSSIETESGGKAYMANPDAIKGLKDEQGNPVDTGDYKVLQNQPALHDWRWEGKDEKGNPIFMRDDLAVHPDAAKRINAMLGKSAFKEWYNEPSEGTAKIPRAIAKALDTAQSVMKREMFGLLAPFHQVQEGTHALGHRVNPFFGIEPVDMRNPKFMDAARHGLMMLPDRATTTGYMEGLGGKGSFLTQALRFFGGKNENLAGRAATGIANVIDGYQDYLFHKYIPALKFKTYESMVARNTEAYAKELKSGQLTDSDVKLLSAEQSNSAYGHLNRDLLDTNPTMQHLKQLLFLAPDFLEARSRFVGQSIKGLLGSKVGEEQFKALAFMALLQGGTAFALSKLSGSQYDPKHPFSVFHGGREYTMRSVPEDMLRLGMDVSGLAKGGDRGIPFLSARLNPLMASLGEMISGRNYRGEKSTMKDSMEELLAKYIPITARSIPGLRSLTETSRQSPITPLEQLAGSLGLKISRHSPITETYANASEWMEKNKIPRDKGSYPVSKYQQLRYALEDGDMQRAKSEYDKLAQGEKRDAIARGFQSSVNHPFTKSSSMDARFRSSLSAADKSVFDLAARKRSEVISAFNQIRK